MAEKAPVKSLASSGNALSQNFKLPALFTKPAPALEARVTNPYISFAHPNRKEEWAQLTSKFGTVADGDTFLFEPGPQITALPVIKCSIINHFKYYARTSGTGEVVATSMEQTATCGKEHIEAILLVYLADRVVAANATFRTTKCGAAITLSQNLEAAGRPEWPNISPLHKETLLMPEPFLRFYGEVVVQPPRTSKESGNPYRATSVQSVKPTGASEWKLIKEWMESENTAKINELVNLRFENRVNAAKAKMQSS